MDAVVLVHADLIKRHVAPPSEVITMSPKLTNGVAKLGTSRPMVPNGTASSGEKSSGSECGDDQVWPPSRLDRTS
jgi:hypothetical protein